MPFDGPKPCGECTFVFDCRSAYLRLAEYQTVEELSHRLFVDEQNTLGLDEACDLCSQMSKEYTSYPRDFRHIPKYREAVKKAKRFCESNGIDLRVYLQTQFITLGGFLKGKRIPLQPGMLFSDGAIRRYREHVRSRMDRDGSLTDLKKANNRWKVSAEFLFAECYVKARLSGVAIAKADVEAFVRKQYPDYDPADCSGRPQALARLLEGLRYGLSRRVAVKRADFDWDDVVSFLERWL